MLADVIRAQAAWRTNTALDRADDPRHGRAEIALLALADYVESNPADVSPETLRRLEGQAARYEQKQGFPDLGKQALSYLRRYGFEYEPDDLAIVLDELAACAVRDAQRDQTRRRL